MVGLGRAGVVWLTCGFAVIVTVACGGTGVEPGSPEMNPAESTATVDSMNPPAIELPQIDLERSLAELEALEAPVGVDPGLFAGLKATLAGLLTEVGTAQLSAATLRSISAADPAELNGAWCLDGNISGGVAVSVSWRGRHLGDYDLNGEVNVADITPLAVFYLQTVEYDRQGLPLVDGDNEVIAQVDGDNNGEVNAADITQIAINFGSRLAGYRLYRGFSTDGAIIDWNPAYLPDGENGASPVTVPWNPGTSPGEVLRYAAGFSHAPEPGVVLYVKAVPFNGSAEGPEGSIPVPEGPHAMFRCSVCHQLTDLAFLGKENSCHGCHATPPEGQQASWAETPGIHGECMGCHQEHIFTIALAEQICGNCHTGQAGEIAGSGMEACLNCHLQAHLPDAQPTAATCGGCHTGQAAELGSGPMQDCLGCHSSHVFSTTYASESCRACHTAPPDIPGGDWSNAPGLHSNCESCHTQHVFVVDQPDSVCADCHGSLIDDGHAGGSTECLTCHNSPHIPETGVTGGNCEECHPVPPENPAAQWTDAPGLHGQCALCHNQPEHGYKPDPPESICGDCHAEPIADGHDPGDTVCLNCHTWPHLPQIQMEGEQCLNCHSDYIGFGNHDGSCLDCHPGDHTTGSPWDACADCHEF